MTKSASIGLVGLVAVLVVVEKGSSLSLRPEKLVCKGFKFAKLGCYTDDQKVPRPLPQLVFTDRDKTSPVYSGILINWKKWDHYMNTLICRCAKQSLSKGYNIVGLQHYGECWSGENKKTSNYARSGPAKRCITWRGKACTGGKDCVGEDHANFIYRVEKDTAQPTGRPTSATRPTKPPTPKPSTPKPTPQTTPKPTPQTTPKPTPQTTPKPTNPGSTPGPSTPTASRTSTAKPSVQPTASPNPCTPAAGVGCQQPAPSCAFPPCMQVAPPYGQVMAPVPYQPPAVSYPMITCGRSRIPCPADCQPKCNQDCCKILHDKTGDSPIHMTTLDDNFADQEDSDK